MTHPPPFLRRLVQTIVSAIACAGASAEVIIGQPVIDTSGDWFAGFKADKIVGNFVFSSYGIGALGGGGPFDTGAKFLGLSFDESKSRGGIVDVCDPTGFAGCASFGLKATVSGNGRFGAEYLVRADGGMLDVRLPLRATLDLPYDGTGGGIPTLGAKFTIGSDWTSAVKALSQPGSGTKQVTPLLATHGPSVQAYVDLIGELGASVGGTICVADCWSGSIPPVGIAGRWELGSVNRNGNGQFRVLDNEVTPAGQALGGIIQYELRLPKLDAEDKTLAASGLGGMLQTQAQDRVAQVKLGIDEAVSALTGVPLSGAVGFDAFGKHIGANYALVESSAGFDTLLRQRVSVQTLPIVTLDFASPVQHLLGSAGGTDHWSAPTHSVSFNLGESITLRNTQASLLGAEARFGMVMFVTNEIELAVEAKVSVEALKASTTLGGIGPLYGPEFVTVPLGSIPVVETTFAAGVQELGGLTFNMLFGPPQEALPFDPLQFAALGAYDGALWEDAHGNALCDTRTTPACAALPQTKFSGVFDLGVGLFPPCVFEPDGCAPSVEQEFFERLLAAVAAGPTGGWREGALRLLDDEGHETFLSALGALDDPGLDLSPGLSDEQFARDAAALLAAVGVQRLTTAPVPEPGTALLLAVALLALSLSRGRRTLRAAE